MNTKAIKHLLECDVFNAAEALFAFCGDLTTRDEETTMSAHHEAGNIANKIGEFIKKYNLDNARDGWENQIIPSPQLPGFVNCTESKDRLKQFRADCMARNLDVSEYTDEELQKELDILDKDMK